MPIDYVKVKRDADDGYLSDCYSLALAFRRGEPDAGIPKDAEKAMFYFTLGMNRGSLKCQREIAYACIHGEGMAKDAQRGLQLLQDGAEKGHLASMEMLGIQYLKGDNMPRDPEKAFALFKTYTERARQQFEELDNITTISEGVVYYPLCLALGVGCAKDTKLAHQLLQELSLKGFFAARRCLEDNAVRFLAVHYLAPELPREGFLAIDLSEVTGRPPVVESPKSVARQAEMLLKRAQEGNAAACLLLGRAYASGDLKRKIQKDPAKAVAFFERGMAGSGDPLDTENSNLACQFLLYDACMRGVGIVKDRHRALELLKDAAGKEHIMSIMELGKYYAEGNDVPRDRKKAFEMFQVYAEEVMRNRKTRHVDAVREEYDVLYYPVCMALGIGCAKNPQKAYDILRRMADLEFGQAARCLHDHGLLNPVMISYLDPDAFLEGARWIDLLDTDGAPFKAAPSGKPQGYVN